MGIAGTQHHWCLVSRGNLRFIMSLLITDGHCHKDTSLKGTEDFSPCVDVHPRASVYKVMSELQAHVWDVGITVHGTHQGKSPQTAAVKLRSHKRRALLWYLSKPFWQWAGVYGGRTQAYEKACYMQLPSGHDKCQESSTESISRLETENKSVKLLSTRSNSISYPQAPEVLSGKEHESWAPTISLLSSLYPSLPLLLC